MVKYGKSQSPTPSFAAPPYMLEPTPTPNPNSQTVTSPDGKMTLKMIRQKGQNDWEWIVFADDKQIFSVNLPEDTTLTVPFNTFSPDNKYVFLKETSPSLVSYPVFATSGQPLTQDGSMLEFSSLFSAKFPSYRITEATGWGGVNLIVFNTAKSDGGGGPSFWFEVPTHVFILLSHKFE